MYIVLFLYGLFELFTSFNHLVIEANLLLISNLVVILFLVFARFNIYKAERDSLKKVSMEIEDIHQVKLERTAYNAQLIFKSPFLFLLFQCL